MKIIFIILALLLAEQADVPKQRERKRSKQTTQEKIKLDKPKEKPPTPGFDISLPDLQPVYGFGNEENAKASQGTKKEPKKEDPKKKEEPKKEEPPPRKSMRWHTAWERLPKGLPKWFYEIDIDEDGQIEMWEWAEDWTEEGWTTEDVEEFKKYDLNDDGIITPEEVLKVEKLK